jgi:hypothetical protein
MRFTHTLHRLAMVKREPHGSRMTTDRRATSSSASYPTTRVVGVGYQHLAHLSQNRIHLFKALSECIGLISEGWAMICIGQSMLLEIPQAGQCCRPCLRNLSAKLSN